MILLTNATFLRSRMFDQLEHSRPWSWKVFELFYAVKSSLIVLIRTKKLRLPLDQYVVSDCFIHLNQNKTKTRKTSQMKRGNQSYDIEASNRGHYDSLKTIKFDMQSSYRLLPNLVMPYSVSIAHWYSSKYKNNGK